MQVVLLVINDVQARFSNEIVQVLGLCLALDRLAALFDNFLNNDLRVFMCNTVLLALFRREE